MTSSWREGWESNPPRSLTQPTTALKAAGSGAQWQGQWFDYKNQALQPLVGNGYDGHFVSIDPNGQYSTYVPALQPGQNYSVPQSAFGNNISYLRSDGLVLNFGQPNTWIPMQGQLGQLTPFAVPPTQNQFGQLFQTPYQSPQDIQYALYKLWGLIP